MTQNQYDFGAIISTTPITGVTTPTNSASLQVQLSEALRNYILAVSPEPLKEVEFLGCCRVQFNFEFQTLSRYASGERSDVRYSTLNGKPLKGLVATVNVTYGAA